MCYDISFFTRKAEKYAKHYGQKEMWSIALEKQNPVHHVSGFEEPQIPVITTDKPSEVQLMHWPFIPMKYADKLNGRPMNTLNARNDTIIKPSSSFHDALTEGRCVIPIDGFYDHHHKSGRAFPFYIQRKNDKPFFIGGLWHRFTDVEDEQMLNCVTMITGMANKEMAWIHNEPKHSPESRMVFVMEESAIELWLNGTVGEALALIKPLPDESLNYHPCKPIKSNKKLNRTYLGNDPAIKQRHYYPELEQQQQSLF